MHKVLRTMSFLAVLGSCLYLAAPVMAADTGNGGGELRQEGTALKEKMQQDHAAMKADREKMEKDRDAMKADREKARALHKQMREKREGRHKDMKEKMKNGATPATPATPAAPGMPAAPATPAGQ